MKKVKENNELNYEKVNEVVKLSSKILKIAYIFIVIVALFFIIKVMQELHVRRAIIVILKILAPLFIGLFLAWFFAPAVKKLQKKGVKRIFGTLIVYLCFIGAIALILGLIIPILRSEINDFIATLPSIFNSIKGWIIDFFSKLTSIKQFNAEAIQDGIFLKIEQYGSSLAITLPDMAVSALRSFISGFGTFVIGLIIGFYLLLGFDNAGSAIKSIIPKKYLNDVKRLGKEINTNIRRFITGALIDAFFVFVITSLAFTIIGLRAPLLFGLFCGITNVIPYAGPYIGGIPAVIVGFSKGPVLGFLTLLSIFVIQFLEGNFLQPVIMSKTTKLHPVTIICGLLIFGHFFGIIGMVVSTPLIAILKSFVVFFIEKMDAEHIEA